jgi:hypothetical protein
MMQPDLFRGMLLHQARISWDTPAGPLAGPFSCARAPPVTTPSGPTDRTNLAEVLRQLAAVGAVVESLDVVTVVGGMRVRLQVVPLTAAEDVNAGTCAADILQTLREQGQRMTTQELLSALEAAERVWGESTVRNSLAALVREGKLTQRQDVRPKGYGLAEWGEG